MAGLMSMADDQEQPKNPLAMGISGLLDDKTKKVLAEHSDNPQFMSRVQELAPKIAQQATGGAPVPPPDISKVAAAAPSKMKTQTKNESQNIEKEGSKTFNYDTDQLDKNSAWIRSQPEYQAQLDEDSTLQNLLSMQARKQRHTNDWFVKPLSQLADAQTGSHLADNMKDKDSAQQTLLKYANESAKRKADMMKTIMDGATKLKTGQENQDTINKILAMRGTGDGGSGFGRGWEDRLDFQKHKYAVDGLVKDPAQAALLTSYQNINNAVKNFEASGKSPQAFKELQQVIRTNAGAGGRSGVEERAGTYAPTWGISKDELVQKIFADPQSVYESSPKIVDMIYQMAKAELQSKRGQAAAQIQTRSQPMQSFYADPMHSNYAKDYENTVKSRKQQFDISDDVTVKNPKTGETHIIPAGPTQAQDIADAAKEGFEAVK